MLAKSLWILYIVVTVINATNAVKDEHYGALRRLLQSTTESADEDTTDAPGPTLTDSAGDDTTDAPGPTLTDSAGEDTTDAPGPTPTDSADDDTTDAPGPTLTDSAGDDTTDAPVTATDSAGGDATDAPGPTPTDSAGDAATNPPGTTLLNPALLEEILDICEEELAVESGEIIDPNAVLAAQCPELACDISEVCITPEAAAQLTAESGAELTCDCALLVCDANCEYYTNSRAHRSNTFIHFVFALVTSIVLDAFH